MRSQSLHCNLNLDLKQIVKKFVLKRFKYIPFYLLLNLRKKMLIYFSSFEMDPILHFYPDRNELNKPLLILVKL